MLYRASFSISMLTFSNRAIAVLLFLGCLGTGFAQTNSGVAPVLVPYTITALAGNTQLATPGFGGDGGPASASTLSAPGVVAVDTVGNVYFAETAYGIINEINAQTGVIKIIAGIPPSKCLGLVCTQINSGCADGVLAAGNAMGSKILGLAVDGWGNVYYADSNNQGIWVIYRGGAKVAAFITLEDGATVTAAGGVLPGYVYHVAGKATPKVGGCTSTASNGDQNVATLSSMHGPKQIGLDAAGNIYVLDVSNGVIRVINAQATTQTFFGVSVPAGYIWSIVNCGTLTKGACPAKSDGAFGGPANTALMAQQQAIAVDQFGDIYEINGNGSGVTYFGGVAYAGAPGSTALAKLINLESGLTATAGNWYEVIDNILLSNGAVNQATLANGSNDIVLRSASVAIDPYLNIWTDDYNRSMISRLDVNSQIVTQFSDTHGIAFGTTAVPAYCNTASNGSKKLTGAQTSDGYGDGCPAPLSHVDSSGGSAIGFDAQGNLYMGEATYNLVRKISVNNVFPATPLATPVTQTMQIHFDPLNLPITSGVTPFPTTSFQITAGGTDFALSATTPPTCSNYTLALDASLECYVAINFTPTLPGNRIATLQVTTATGSVYNFALNGVGTGTQFAVDGGAQAVVGTTSLGKTSAVAVGPSGTLYIADSANNRVVVQPAMASITGQSVLGSPTLTSVAGTSGLTVGQAIASAAFPSGTTVVSVGPGTVTLSANATATSLAGQFTLGSVTVIPSNTAGLAIGQVITDPGIPSGTKIILVGSTGYVNLSAAATATVLAPGVTVTWAVAPTTIGTGLNGPMGVATDAAGNVYISDTGNNRVVEVAAVTGTQTVLASNITWKAPQGLVVDALGNVYVADTGNARIVEISPWAEFGATPLLDFANAPTLKTPVAVAVDSKGNIFVADTGLSQVVEIPPGGGDLQSVVGAGTTLSAFGLNLTTPNGVAVDGGGNLYVSDSTSNNVVMVPSGSGPGSEQFLIGFTGLSSPAGLALDANANVYVADSGNSRVLFENRNQISIPFGLLPQFQPASTATLTVSNIGVTGQNLALLSPFTTVSGDTANFGLAASSTVCVPGSTLLAGIHCNLTPSFAPVVNGPLAESVSVQGGAATLSLTGTGQNALVAIALAITSPTTGPVYGTPVVIGATVTQPNGTNTPGGTLTFSYTINGVSQTPVTVPLVASGSISTATLTLDGLRIARNYVITATYSGDGVDSQTVSAPLKFTVPGRALTVVANSVSYTYGGTVPPLVGTVTGILPADAPGITVTIASGATQYSPAGTYPIVAVLSGGNAADYTIPVTLTPAGTPATVTENGAPLTITVIDETEPYGYPNLTLGLVGGSTPPGTLHGDTFTWSYGVLGGALPVRTSILDVGKYTIVPVATSANIGNYAVTYTNGTLTVLQATPVMTVTQTAAAVLPGNIAADTIAAYMTNSTYDAGKGPVQGSGTPSGTVTVTDIFTPIVSSAPGTSAQITSALGPLPVIAGAASYTITSTTPGTHSYTYAYSGDKNFTAISSVAAIPTNILVDPQDFSVTATFSPILIFPGTVPGGDPTQVGEVAAYPQISTVTFTPILGYTGTVSLSCASGYPYSTPPVFAPPSAVSIFPAGTTLPIAPTSYVSCSLLPTSLTFAGKALTSVLSISTPLTLPIGFTSELRKSGSATMLAFLPFGLLAFLPFYRHGRRGLSKALWMLLAIMAISVGMSGCGGNLTQFYTPVPTGAQYVTVTATDGNVTRSFTVQIQIQ